jgi:hypothetical protein
MTGLPTIENIRSKKTVAKPDPFLAGPPEEAIETKKIELEVKSVPINLIAVVGDDTGYMRRSIQVRLSSRQAHAMHVLVEGLDHTSPLAIGRRSNEQDLIRSLLESVADQLNLPRD